MIDSSIAYIVNTHTRDKPAVFKRITYVCVTCCLRGFGRFPKDWNVGGRPSKTAIIYFRCTIFSSLITYFSLGLRWEKTTFYDRSSENMSRPPFGRTAHNNNLPFTRHLPSQQPCVRVIASAKLKRFHNSSPCRVTFNLPLYTRRRLRFPILLRSVGQRRFSLHRHHAYPPGNTGKETDYFLMSFCRINTTQRTLIKFDFSYLRRTYTRETSHARAINRTNLIYDQKCFTE